MSVAVLGGDKPSVKRCSTTSGWRFNLRGAWNWVKVQVYIKQKNIFEKVTNGKSSNITFKLVSHIIIDELGWELFSGTLTIQDPALYFFQVTTRQSKVIKTVARNKILVT